MEKHKEPICCETPCCSPKDSHSYRGWINSDSFIKRSLAITFYSTIGTYVLVLMVYIAAAVLGLLGLSVWGALEFTKVGFAKSTEWISNLPRQIPSQH